MKIINKSFRFFAEEDLIARRVFNQAPLKYIVGEKVTRVFKEVYSRDRGEH